MLRVLMYSTSVAALCGTFVPANMVVADDVRSGVGRPTTDADSPADIAEKYDVVTTENGFRYRVDPSWIEPLGETRGTPPERFNLSEFAFIRFGDVTANPYRFRAQSVKSIDYWEQRATREVRRLIAKDEYDEAAALLASIAGFNPSWNPEDLRQLEAVIKVAQASRLLNGVGGDAAVQRGLDLLEEVAGFDEAVWAATSFAVQYEATYLRLAADARATQDYDLMRRMLRQLRNRFPDSQELRTVDADVFREATELINQSEAAAHNGNPRSAIELALGAQQVAGDDVRITPRVLALLRNYQRLRVACYETPGAFDPFNALQPLERQVLPLVFDRLLETGGEQAAAFYESPIVETYRLRDGFTLEEDGSHTIALEITLKEGIMFSDGSPVSAGDIAATVRSLRDERNRAFDPEWARMVRAVQVTGARTFVVRMRQLVAPQSLLTIPILPERQLVSLPEPGSKFSLSPIGTGPFVVVAPDGRNPRIAVELAANPRFRELAGGRPYIKQIQFIKYNMRGSGQAVDDLERKEVEVLTDPTPLQLDRLASAPGEFVIRPFQSDSVWILALNHRRPVFQKFAVRNALLRGINRRDILDRWFSAGGANSSLPQGGPALSHAVVTGPFAPHSPACDPSLQVVEYDAGFAASALSAIDIPDGQLLLKYSTTGDSHLERAMDQIAHDCRKIGLRVQTNARPPNAFIHEVLEQHDFDIACYRIDHNDVLHNVARLFDASPKQMRPGGTNFMGYADQALTQLFVDLRNEQQVDRIWAIQHRIHGYFYNTLPFIPLWRLDGCVVHTSRLAGRKANGEVVTLPIDRQYLFRRVEDWYLDPEQAVGSVPGP